MKRLDQLTEEDLREQHDLMMGVHDDGIMEGLDAVSYGIDPIALLEAKELYDELDRLGKEETREAAERSSADALRQPRHWQDKRQPRTVRARVWRKAPADTRKLGQDKQADA